MKARSEVALEVLVILALAGLPWPATATAQATVTERVSVSSDGTQGDAWSWNGHVSADGRFVTFDSEASNLVVGDTNSCSDVFVRDRLAGVTIRVSVASDGAQATGNSWAESISADGQVVSFSSDAPNLVSGDTNQTFDVFVHDCGLGVTERASVSSQGQEGNSLSLSSWLSADGRAVAFCSHASNLVPGDSNVARDTFLRRRTLGVTRRVSVGSQGQQGSGESWGGWMSEDVRWVTFHSDAPDLVTGDTNGCPDVFVRDLWTGTTERVSVSSSGAESNDESYGGSISADGRFVVFQSWGSNLVDGDHNGTEDVFVRDRLTNTTERVSVSSSGAEGDAYSWGWGISADGRLVFFESTSRNLVPGDTNERNDVFVRDRLTRQTLRVSLTSTGDQANDACANASSSADGRFVAFHSSATNLVPGDTNGENDVFIRGPFDWPFFGDGFEYGDTAAWAVVVP